MYKFWNGGFCIMGVKLELTISRTETIQPKQDEVIYSINWDNGKFDFFYNGSIYPVIVSIGKIITFETENPVIIDFINWVDTVDEVAITEEYDNKCIEFEKAVTAETGYNFKTEFNEFTNENTIERIGIEDRIYWDF